jgi:hypothetical protein
MGRLPFFVLLACSFAPGCAVAQAHRSQDQIRVALLDLYTDQVMDNLIRAHNRMPIIQLDYTTAQGMITVKGTASAGDQQTWANSVTSVFNTALGFENTNQITLSATPVTASNEVYDAYLQYLSIPDSLITTAEPPPPGAAHICRTCGDMYYWVPVWCRDKFFELALLSTAQRGKSLLPADEFYTVKVLGTIGDTEPYEKDRNYVFVTIRLDRLIPNDDGHVEFLQPLTVEPVTAAPPAPAAPSPPAPNEGPPDGHGALELQQARGQAPGEEPPTDHDPPAQSKPAAEPGTAKRPLEYPFAKSATKEGFMPSFVDHVKITCLKSELPALNVPRPAKVFLQHRQPTLPSTDDLLQRINFNLQQLNQNVVRQPGL